MLPGLAGNEGQYVYAGFFDRLKAGFADAIILSAIETPISFIAATLSHIQSVHIIAAGSTMLISYLYYPVLESSKLQSTLGKKLCGLKVTGLRGERLSLQRALGKQTIQFIAAGILFGGVFLLAGATHTFQSMVAIGFLYLLANIFYFAMHSCILFTTRKQSVFDKVTGRLVFRKLKEPTRLISNG
jgi:uncharacterized RDD family membrane protein YckC